MRDRESKPFQADKYPRVYKPDGMGLFFGGVLLFIWIGMMTQAFLQHIGIFNLPLDNYKSILLGMFVLAILIFSLYITLISTFGYRVTLMPDAIKVTTLLGTKVMQRNDISSYGFYVSTAETGIFLKSRDTTISGVSVALLKDPNKITLSIPLTFNRDDEFDDWIMSLPCEIGDSPLPKRQEG